MGNGGVNKTCSACGVLQGGVPPSVTGSEMVGVAMADDITGSGANCDGSGAGATTRAAGSGRMQLDDGSAVKVTGESGRGSHCRRR